MLLTSLICRKVTMNLQLSFLVMAMRFPFRTQPPQELGACVHSLYTLWDLSMSWQDEQQDGRILCWFVDHRAEQPLCTQPRPVALPPDPIHWRQTV